MKSLTHRDNWVKSMCTSFGEECTVVGYASKNVLQFWYGNTACKGIIHVCLSWHPIEQFRN